MRKPQSTAIAEINDKELGIDFGCMMPDFALFPMIAPFDCVHFDKREEYKSGDIVAVEIEGNVYIRVLRRAADRLTFAVTNEEYMGDTFSLAEMGSVSILGAAKCLTRRIDGVFFDD